MQHLISYVSRVLYDGALRIAVVVSCMSACFSLWLNYVPFYLHLLLSDRELLIALVANAIAVYSILHERGELPEKTTMYGFVLDAVGTAKYKTKLTPEIIDDVFASVTSAHNS